jgi:hypothetical protein
MQKQAKQVIGFILSNPYPSAGGGGYRHIELHIFSTFQHDAMDDVAQNLNGRYAQDYTNCAAAIKQETGSTVYYLPTSSSGRTGLTLRWQDDDNDHGRGTWYGMHIERMELNRRAIKLLNQVYDLCAGRGDARTGKDSHYCPDTSPQTLIGWLRGSYKAIPLKYMSAPVSQYVQDKDWQLPAYAVPAPKEPTAEIEAVY